MGCQNSKLSSDAEAVPPKVRPLLRRRLDEMRGRRKNGISKKELLDSHSSKTISSSSPEESVASAKAQPFTTKSREFESIPEENRTAFPNAEQKTEEEEEEEEVEEKKSIEPSMAKPVIMEEEISDVVPESDGKEPEKHESKGDEENAEGNGGDVEDTEKETSGKDAKEEHEDERDEKALEVAERKTTEEENEDEDEDEDEETSEDEGSEANICPGSPSFRVYCIPTSPNRQESETLLDTQEIDCELS